LAISEAFEPLEPSSPAEEVQRHAKEEAQAPRLRLAAWHRRPYAGGRLRHRSKAGGGNRQRSCEAHQAPPVPVTVAEVSQHDVPVYLDGLGTVQASNTVAVHSQVDGKLQSVNFVEGQKVKAGDVLAIVDPRPFQAALDQAKAKKAQDEAQLVSDAKDLARFQDLMKKGAGTSAGRGPAAGKSRRSQGNDCFRSSRHREL
jgi:multidrug efflux pump subunit AcrA (membrane-fusion protein)